MFNVVDYKTGDSVRFSVEAVLRGLALQLPLYAMATTEVVLGEVFEVADRTGQEAPAQG